MFFQKIKWGKRIKNIYSVFKISKIIFIINKRYNLIFIITKLKTLKAGQQY